ncbi:hypothetical protein [Chondromyces apiculatus]|uniref:Uncharacterized protein n=1 Tax=Chondromyces apiculatus DSM 436 TaxID=1192034 RepID=A0A017TDP1_9BACT|nr:hypothetical protein [Chondromyces apiculatus]EYF07022.1 Hypothetical protein CAP_1281 [Chondromyces apiculatus DSM 436]
MHRRTLLHLGASLAAVPLLPRIALAQDVCEPPKDTVERVVARVGNNHGHVFVVSPADVQACVGKTYDIAGTSGHPHAVTLSADDFKRLGKGEILRTTSTRVGGHIHRLLVRCAPTVEPPESINACTIEIGGKDEHEFVIPEAHLASPEDRTYDIQGIASHSHAVLIPAAGFRKLVAGEQLALNTSPSDGHGHVVFVRYDARKPRPAPTPPKG